MEYSHIVVGAGSAGCVVAERLSARPDNRVLVVEAGRDYRPDATPAEVRSLNNLRAVASDDLTWRLTAQVCDGSADVPLQQGRGVGGSSAVNNTWALRARPGDVARWAARGASGISWHDLAARYAAIENDLDHGTADGHSRSGPLPISRLPTHEWPALDAAVAAAAADAGFGWSPDLNRADATGAGPVPMTVRDRGRVSANDAFLEPARARGNVDVLGGTSAIEIVLQGTRAVGVVVQRDGGTTTLRADTVVVCAGAVQSPLLLQRSGIGRPGDLAAAGVPVRVDAPEVGHNLVEHPLVALFASLAPDARVGTTEARQVNCLVRPGGTADGDTWHVACMSQSPLGDSLAVGFAALMSPSSRGSARITATGPRVELRCLSTDADVDGLAAGLDHLVALMQAPPVAALLDGPLLTMTGPFERPATAEARAAFLRGTCQPYRHLAGTCRMSDDDSGVVDSRHAVRGTEGLYVVDASVLPDATSSNINLTVIAVAHRAGDLLARGR